MININGIENDISRETANRAFYWTSHVPEKRGESVIANYIEQLTALASYIAENAKDEKQKAIAQETFDRLRASYKAKTLSWLSAHSRCISSMITGPANFPVRRAEKANNAEHKRLGELADFSKNMRSYATKSLNSVYSKEEIRGSEIEQIRASIESAEKRQEFMKAANALYRKKDMEGLSAHFATRYGQSAGEKMQDFLKPSYTGAVWGFERWQLSNNLANIKRMKERLLELEKREERAASENPAPAEKLNGLEIVRNYTEERLQLIFDGKPCESVRLLLKSHGFKWSPRFSAWQRQLTQNAENALKYRVLTSETMKQYMV